MPNGIQDALKDRWCPSGNILGTLTLDPIGTVYTALGAQLRLAIKFGEFLRLIQIKGTFVGIPFERVFASGGQFERLVDVPRLPVFWLLPFLWSVKGLAATFISKREGVFC